jgi:ribulose-phosphate 3-epimerase
MSVNPGFGGQAFIADVLPKVRAIRTMIDRAGVPVDLEIDGGISRETAALATAQGARVLVAGTAVFSQPSYADAIGALRREGERGMGQAR